MYLLGISEKLNSDIDTVNKIQKQAAKSDSSKIKKEDHKEEEGS